MPDKFIKIKIDVKKIDKTKLYTSEKTGAVYLDATILWNDEQDQYNNNGMIVQDIPKADRDAGQKGAILGNCKLQSVTGKKPSNPAADVAEPMDDLPF